MRSRLFSGFLLLLVVDVEVFELVGVLTSGDHTNVITERLALEKPLGEVLRKGGIGKDFRMEISDVSQKPFNPIQIPNTIKYDCVRPHGSHVFIYC